jgi:hypothetical protein
VFVDCSGLLPVNKSGFTTLSHLFHCFSRLHKKCLFYIRISHVQSINQSTETINQVLGALQRCLLPKHPPRPPPPPIPSNNSSSRGGDYSPRALAARALAAKSAALTSPQHAQVQVRGPSRSQEPSHEASSSSSSFGVVEPFSMNPLQTTSDFHPILSFSSSSYPAAHALHWIAVEYLKVRPK